MGIELKSEKPFVYVDKDTGAEVPVRKYLDINTGETVIFVMYKKMLTPVHIPKKATKNKLWMTSLGYTDIKNPLMTREFRNEADFNAIKSASTKESGAVPIWSA